MRPDTRITYQDLGKGPAVVLLHDFLLTPDSWRHQVPALLETGYRVILPDLASCPGNGRLSDFSTAILALLDRLGLGRAVICGHGMGGSVLFELLERHAQRIAGAGFISTRPVADDIQEKARRAELIADLLHHDGWSVREELLKMLLAGREIQLIDEQHLEIQKIVHGYDRQALINGLQAMLTRMDYTRLLKQLILPTLVIGGESDTICHPAHTRIMAEKLPTCIRAVNLESGHLIQLEQPAALNRYLLDFLKVIVPRILQGTTLSCQQAA